jgi:hypothetical protein
MNDHDKLKYFTSHSHQDPLSIEKQYATDFFEKNTFTPIKRNQQN